jgi:hypothetical protein
MTGLEIFFGLIADKEEREDRMKQEEKTMYKSVYFLLFYRGCLTIFYSSSPQPARGPASGQLSLQYAASYYDRQVQNRREEVERPRA